MRDIEQRLGSALAAGADRAPAAPGLAAAARRRHRVRRRRHLAAAGAAAVATLATIAAVLSVAPGADDRPHVADDPTPATSTPWRTIEHEGVLVDVPGDWRRLDCEEGWVQVGRDASSCADGPGLSVHGAVTFDPLMGPGVVVDGEGYVIVDRLAVSVATDDDARTRRILDSVRRAPSPSDEVR